jgi:hypothetical protein
MAEMTCSTDLDVSDTFKVGDQVLDQSLPSVESFNEDVGRAQLVTVGNGRV